MIASKVNNYIGRTNTSPKCDNAVDSLQKAYFFKKLFGSAVFEYSIKFGEIQSRFSYFGLFCFLFWSKLYFYCVYKTYSEDQSILRLLYNTKLKRYGDDYERVAATVMVLYAFFKIPFNLNVSTDYIQSIYDIDKSMKETLGVTVDHNKNSYRYLFLIFCQLAAYVTRGLCILMTISHLDITFPFHKMFQVMFTDVAAFMISGNYSYCVTSLKKRYALINNILDDIKLQKRERPNFLVNSNLIQTDAMDDQYVCKRIKMCAKIHCMLYRVTKKVNQLFGFALIMTIFFAFTMIVLYMFYFMEATASGLFHDPQRYVYFFIYVTWQAAYAMGVIFIVVYFSQSTVQMALHAAYLTQEIINSDLSPLITKEAVQLSLQLHHQVPTFAAYGVALDYVLLIQGAHSVVTVLVMLLQFVTDS